MSTRAPTLAELKQVRALLERFGVTSREAEPFLRAREVKRHAVLMSAGDDPNQSGVVLSGVHLSRLRRRLPKLKAPSSKTR